VLAMKLMGHVCMDVRLITLGEVVVMNLVQMDVIRVYVIMNLEIAQMDAQLQRYMVLVVIFHVMKVVREARATEILDIVIKDVKKELTEIIVTNCVAKVA
jgi:hypothetical protein